jgi:hypothetical protein
MPSHELERMIKQIDQKIRALETAKQVLLDEFGEKHLPATQLPMPKGGGSRAETAKERIVRLLEEAGPLSRKNIRAMTGMPLGTVSYNLNDKNVFYSMNNKWHLVRKRKGGDAMNNDQSVGQQSSIN